MPGISSSSGDEVLIRKQENGQVALQTIEYRKEEVYIATIIYTQKQLRQFIDILEEELDEA